MGSVAQYRGEVRSSRQQGQRRTIQPACDRLPAPWWRPSCVSPARLILRCRGGRTGRRCRGTCRCMSRHRRQQRRPGPSRGWP